MFVSVLSVATRIHWYVYPGLVSPLAGVFGAAATAAVAALVSVRCRW